MILCEYGCGQEAKYQLGIKKWCCSKFFNSCPELKKKNSFSLKKTYLEGRKFNVGFNSENRIKSHISHRENLMKKPFEEWGNKLRRDFILKEQNEKCLSCKIQKEWNNKPLIFELDHIDGNNKNNLRENLRLLCPNCHSQTETWKGRGNKGWQKIKISEEDIIKKLIELKSINQTIIFFNYAATKGIYDRFYKIIKKNKLEEVIFEDRINKKILKNISNLNEKNKSIEFSLKEKIKKQEILLEAKIKELDVIAKHIDKTKKLSHFGKKNSQYNTCWIYNIELKENKKIKKIELEDWLNKNWVKGRKQVWDNGYNLGKRLIANRNKIWIYNPLTLQKKFLKLENAILFLSNDWLKGRK